MRLPRVSSPARCASRRAESAFHIKPLVTRSHQAERQLHETDLLVADLFDFVRRREAPRSAIELRGNDPNSARWGRSPSTSAAVKGRGSGSAPAAQRSPPPRTRCEPSAPKPRRGSTPNDRAAPRHEPAAERTRASCAHSRRRSRTPSAEPPPSAPEGAPRGDEAKAAPHTQRNSSALQA